MKPTPPSFSCIHREFYCKSKKQSKHILRYQATSMCIPTPLFINRRRRRTHYRQRRRRRRIEKETNVSFFYLLQQRVLIKQQATNRGRRRRRRMVGIFSRFNVTRGSHRRSQSAIDERAGLQPSAEAVAATAAAVAAAHGLEVALEFKPVEHPVEPFDNDQPVKCPLPEPSILNDGRIWKERFSANTTRGSEFSSTNEGASEATGITKSRSSNSNRLILPSLSAPEHNLINLLEECNASGI